jgi:hypothetical protein
MCNLYSVTRGQAAIRAMFRVGHDPHCEASVIAWEPKLLRVSERAGADKRMTASVKGFGCRPLTGDAANSGGRHPKPFT